MTASSMATFIFMRWWCRKATTFSISPRQWKKRELGKRDEFLKVVRTDTALVRDLDPQAPSLEGYLFPDTYHFTRTQSLHDMAAAMVRRFPPGRKGQD